MTTLTFSEGRRIVLSQLDTRIRGALVYGEELYFHPNHFVMIAGGRYPSLRRMSHGQLIVHGDITALEVSHE